MSREMPPGSSLRARALTLATEMVQSSVRDVVYVLFRHKWTITVFFLVVVASVTVYVFVSPEIFRSESKLLIRLGRENLSADPSVTGPTMGVAQNRENEVNSELSILTSRFIAEQVVDSTGESAFLEQPHDLTTKERIYKMVRGGMALPGTLLAQANPDVPLPPRESAVNKVQKGLTVEVEKKTNIINVKYEARSPQAAQNTLERMVKAYMDRHIQVYSAQATPQFFEEQAAKRQEELATREQERDVYRKKFGIATMDKQKESLLQQISATENQRADASAQASSSEARVAGLEDSLKGHSKTHVTSETTGIANEASDKLKSSVTDMRLRETDLAQRYPATHRPLVELRAQIKQAEQMLGKEKDSRTTVTTGIDENYQQLQLQLDTEQAQFKANQARAEALAAEVAKQKEQLAELTSREAELTRIDRDVEVAEKEYRQYREGLQRAKISAAMDIDKVSNVSLVQPATLSAAPVKPQKLRDIALALFLGIFGGVFLAFSLEYIDDTLHTKEDVEKRLGVPVLAVITDEEFKACT